jgi:uncharacterized membrane protein YkoI
MKSYFVLLFFAAIMSVESFSQQDTVAAPTTIRTSFNTMYPNASRVMWYRYEPSKMKPETSDWYYVLDPSDYYVSFNWQDADYIAWYDNGTWLHSTTRMDASDVPSAVDQAIRSQYPGYIVTDVDLEKGKNNDMVYEVNLEKGFDRWKIHYSPTGTVLKKKQKTASKVEIENAMATDFEKRYPNVTDVVWYSYLPGDRVDVIPGDWDYTMDENDYEVRYIMDGTNYVAYYDNGAWVRSSTMDFDASKLPSPVKNSINTQYAGYTIKDVDREDNKSQVLYEVELVKGNQKCKIHYTADGSVSKKKCRNI